MRELTSKDYSNAYCLGTQLIRYTTHVDKGLDVAELSLKRIEAILNALEFQDTDYYIDLIKQNAKLKMRYDEVREIAIHLGMILSTKKTFELGTLCSFGWNLPFFKLALESGANLNTLDIARGELQEHFEQIKGILPSNITELISNYIKESEGIMPKTEKAIKMANILDDVWKNLEMILDSKDIKESVLFNPKKVFIVHGHDEVMLYSVSSFLQKIDMEPIILKDQPNKGLSVIEKFENEAKNAGFCISIFSPDDVGRAYNKEDKLQKRARQNVIFELGYFTGMLGRDRTCVLYKEGVEIPSDYKGIIYIKFDSEGAWKITLAREMRVAKMNMNIDKIL